MPGRQRVGLGSISRPCWRVVLAFALIVPLLAPARVSARAACPLWLDAVAAVAPDLVWVGGSGCHHPLIERWDGSAWAVDWLGPGRGSIAAIAAAGPDEAWAVGSRYSLRLGQLVPSILRWDGTAWTQIPAPWDSDYAELLDVEVRDGEVWAVGEGPNATRLVVRWNGSAFERVPLPRGYGGLTGVALTSDGRVWVVDGYGQAFVRSAGDWRRAPLPHLSRQATAVRSIDAGGRLLGVGDTGYFPEDGPVTRALATRWIGTRWAVDRLGPAGELDDVEVVSPDRAWAVGCAGRDVGCYSNRTSALVLRRDADGAWRPVPVPSVGRSAGLVSVDVAGDIGVWVVGRWSDRSGDSHPLVFFRERGEWVRTYPSIYL